MLRPKKLLWKLLESYLVITIFSLLTVAIFVTQSLKHFYFQQTRYMLEARAELFGGQIRGSLSLDRAEEISRLCREAGSQTGTRITVIMANGVVIGDSDESYRVMDNHGDRPEVKAALSGGVGVATRYSYTLRKDLMYVAIPLESRDTVIGMVRTSRPVTTIAGTLQGLYLRIVVVVLLVAAAAGIASFMVSRWMNAQIRDIIRGAEKFSGGNLSHRISVEGIEELESLAGRMNAMASQLDERINTITKQKNEMEAVLSGMVEAVIAVDRDERILEYNPAARRIFNFGDENVKSKSIQEVIRNTRIQQFIEDVLFGDIPIEDDIILYGEDERVLHIHGTCLSDVGGKHLGAVIVFNDITRLKKLENVRRDFAANVSHELKTPITSILGFVETLRDGAINDTEHRDHFLDIIQKHSKRLNSIIDDLLSLSQIERETEIGSIEFERDNLCEILSAAVSLFEQQARDKDIKLTLDCANISVNVNPSLLQHAVANLVDNAVKYTGEKGSVSVSAHRKGDIVLVEVSDTGCGIPPEHIPRIFERFYRVDKGRSRELGGTGLGLAIVKHIVLAHNGRVSVESAPGRGSTFTIILPAE